MTSTAIKSFIRWFYWLLHMLTHNLYEFGENPASGKPGAKGYSRNPQWTITNVSTYQANSKPLSHMAVALAVTCLCSDFPAQDLPLPSAQAHNFTSFCACLPRRCFQHLCLPFRPLTYLTWPIACRNSTGLHDWTFPPDCPPNPVALSEAGPSYRFYVFRETPASGKPGASGSSKSSDLRPDSCAKLTCVRCVLSLPLVIGPADCNH